MGALGRDTPAPADHDDDALYALWRPADRIGFGTIARVPRS
jgi:hypothetical protein